MTPFAVWVEWNNPNPPLKNPAWLLAPVLAYCSEGSATGCAPGASLVVGVRAVVPGETSTSGFLIDRRRRQLLVGDVRLYDRSNLAARLGVSADSASDIELLSLSIDKFGTDCLQFLVGDFAFVVWDWGRRHLWAARDPFGVRALFFCRLPDGIVLASDVRQLLLLICRRKGSLSVSDIDATSSFMFLLRGSCRRDRSYFRDIGQIGPAHTLDAGEGSLSIERYWLPPQSEVRRNDYQEYIDEWRSLFDAAVHDRLRCAFRVAAHVSGGLDSGSIVGAANDHFLATTAGSPRSRPIALSAVFPGLDCDETDLIQATLARAPVFSSVLWDGCQPNHDDFDTPHLTRPGFHGALSTSQWKDAELASSRGARVLLAGDGGDEVGWSRGIFRDLVANGDLVNLLRELFQFRTWETRRKYVKDGLWGLLPIRNRSWSAWRQHLEMQPDWLGPAVASRFRACLAEMSRADPVLCLSHTQSEIWQTLASATAFYAVDARILAGFEGGVEVREPFFDVRLARFVLSVPWRQRFPRGDMRRLHRDAARVLLTDAVRARIRKTTFDSAIIHHAHANLERVRATVMSSRWLSGDLVDQTQARYLLARCLLKGTRDSNLNDWYALFRIAAFECWLRTLSSYYPGQEV